MERKLQIDRVSLAWDNDYKIHKQKHDMSVTRNTMVTTIWSKELSSNLKRKNQSNCGVFFLFNRLELGITNFFGKWFKSLQWAGSRATRA